MIARRNIRDRANALARSTLAPLPLAFWERAFPKDVLALCYHVVSDSDLPHLQLYPYKSAAQFEADVLFARPRALGYRQVADHRLNGTPLPSNGILFTFDDGLIQCFDVMRPILRRHGVDGVFFVTTDYLDDRQVFFECALSLCLSAISTVSPERAAAILVEVERRHGTLPSDPTRRLRASQRLAATRLSFGDDEAHRSLIERAFQINEGDAELETLCATLEIDVAAYARATPMFMSRANVRELVAEGFTVGAHGRKHRSFERLSSTELEREIVASCEAVRSITGRARVPFAFPYSGLGIDRTVLAGILERNSVVEMIFDSGCLRNDPRFIVNRVFTDVPTPTLPIASSNVPLTLRESWSVPSAWYRSR